MKFDITQRMHVVDDAIDRCTNPFHKAILENYRRHANLEVCGMWEQILVPEMTATDAAYRVHVCEKLLAASSASSPTTARPSWPERSSTTVRI